MTFDRVSKKIATDCTPGGARVEVDVIKAKDPITKKDTYRALEGYDATAEDDVHKCDDRKPSVSISPIDDDGSNAQIRVTVQRGTHALATLDVLVDGESIGSRSVSGSGTFNFTYSGDGGGHTVTANVRDSAYYSGSATRNFNLSGGGNDDSAYENNGRWSRGRLSRMMDQ